MEQILRLTAIKSTIFSGWSVYLQSAQLDLQCGLAKVTAKGDPQYQKFSIAGSWRNLSKMFPVEQLHQGAALLQLVHSWSIEPQFFLLSLLKLSNQGSALSRLFLGPLI